MDDGFSGKAAAEIVGISYRQLDYWTRTGLIAPELASARGSGSRRKYSYRNLLELKLVKTMLDSGIKLESVREGFAYLRETLGQEVASARLVIADGAATLVTDDAQMVDVINRFHGQGVLNLIDLDGLKGQVDAAVLEMDAPVADLPLAAQA
jgi:DNA-binding transcriptional MerR regulator